MDGGCNSYGRLDHRDRPGTPLPLLLSLEHKFSPSLTPVLFQLPHLESLAQPIAICWPGLWHHCDCPRRREHVSWVPGHNDTEPSGI